MIASVNATFPLATRQDRQADRPVPLDSASCESLPGSNKGRECPCGHPSLDRIDVYGVGSPTVTPKMSVLPNVVLPCGHSLFGPGRSAVECVAGSSAAAPVLLLVADDGLSRAGKDVLDERLPVGVDGGADGRVARCRSTRRCRSPGWRPRSCSRRGTPRSGRWRWTRGRRRPRRGAAASTVSSGAT